MTRHNLLRALAIAGLTLTSAPVAAGWKAASPEVEAAARDPRIAEVLAMVDRLDAAAMADDHAAFAAAMADDLAVNNPQNRMSVRGATQGRNAAGQISYSRYDRTIEYAAMRGDMVLLMGDERVVPKAGPEAGKQVRRRFTDLWRKDESGWRLTARQATVVASE